LRGDITAQQSLVQDKQGFLARFHCVPLWGNAMQMHHGPFGRKRSFIRTGRGITAPVRLVCIDRLEELTRLARRFAA
jgi:hypothetical protein